MPTKESPAGKQAATDAAVAEATEVKTISVPFRGETYTVKAKRLGSVQMRLRLQKSQDIAAMEWLLGERQFEKFLLATADEDGCTDQLVWGEFMTAVGEAVGAGNS